MVDFAHARDDHSHPPSALKPFSLPRLISRRVTQYGLPPSKQPSRRTDVGTVVLHWLNATAFFVSLLTGLRIAADNVDAVVSKWLAPILPQGEIWTWHFIAGLALFFCASAYLLYMRRSGLFRRVALKKTRVFVLPTANKLRFGALNVVLHWALYAIIIVMTTTGVMLYLGHGGWWVYVHSITAFVAIGYVVAHLASHFAFGGVQQWLRVFRPSPLALTKAVQPKPLLVGIVCGTAIAASIAALDWATRDTLVVRRVSRAPNSERLLDDPAWANLRPVRIHTQQGVNLGGTGESLVEVRAVHDGKKIYFAFRWEDPSRSVRRLPLIKKADGWHHLGNNPYSDDVTTFYEDKFSVVFSPSSAFGSGGVAHFGNKPLSDQPGSRNGRGLHYTDGSLVDMWQWKPSRGGLLGKLDDQYIGPPRDPTPDEASRVARYQGGYWGDPGNAYYSYNFAALRPEEYHGQSIAIKRLPKDYLAMSKKMGRWDPDPDASVDEGSHWWMLEEESIPYSSELDAKIPAGTIIPGVMIIGNYEGDRADVSGSARWRDGHWTLIASRDMITRSKYDQDFAPDRKLYMWVAVFDHTQTRHTRHPRPVRIVVEP
jgi:hypothetical protein